MSSSLLDKSKEGVEPTRNYSSHYEYEKALAKSHGLNYNQYRERTAKIRMKQPKNRRLSSLINNKLQELRSELGPEINQEWLAKESGISRSQISRYIHGYNLP